MKSIIAVCIVAMACTVAGADQKELTGKLAVFHAGSLSVPFKQISAEFSKRHPKVKI